MKIEGKSEARDTRKKWCRKYEVHFLKTRKQKSIPREKDAFSGLIHINIKL